MTEHEISPDLTVEDIHALRYSHYKSQIGMTAVEKRKDNAQRYNKAVSWFKNSGCNFKSVTPDKSDKKRNIKFSKPVLDTRGFKFDKEYANER